MTVTKSNYCAYQTHYQVSFSVKYKKVLLLTEIINKLEELTVEISERYEIEYEKIGYEKNHVHILYSFHQKYSIAEIVRKYQSIAA